MERIWRISFARTRDRICIRSQRQTCFQVSLPLSHTVCAVLPNMGLPRSIFYQCYRILRYCSPVLCHFTKTIQRPEHGIKCMLDFCPGNIFVGVFTSCLASCHCNAFHYGGLLYFHLLVLRKNNADCNAAGSDVRLYYGICHGNSS